MPEPTTDRTLLERIGRLADEGQDLYGGEPMDKLSEARLEAIGDELKQCWDLLRRRRALREFGRNPDAADAVFGLADDERVREPVPEPDAEPEAPST